MHDEITKTAYILFLVFLLIYFTIKNLKGHWPVLKPKKTLCCHTSLPKVNKKHASKLNLSYYQSKNTVITRKDLCFVSEN